MRTLLLFSCLLVAAAMANDTKEIIMVFGRNMATSFDACTKELGVNIEDIITEMAKMKDSTPEKSGCFVACVMKHEGMMKDGKIILESLKEKVANVYKNKPEHMEHMTNTAVECASKGENSKDECQVAFDSVNCFLEKVAS